MDVSQSPALGKGTQMQLLLAFVKENRAGTESIRLLRRDSGAPVLQGAE